MHEALLFMQINLPWLQSKDMITVIRLSVPRILKMNPSISPRMSDQAILSPGRHRKSKRRSSLVPETEVELNCFPTGQRSMLDSQETRLEKRGSVSPLATRGTSSARRRPSEGSLYSWNKVQKNQECGGSSRVQDVVTTRDLRFSVYETTVHACLHWDEASNLKDIVLVVSSDKLKTLICDPFVRDLLLVLPHDCLVLSVLTIYNIGKRYRVNSIIDLTCR